MPQNGIYASGITALSEAFRSNPHLKILNLNDNTVGKKGAAALAKALPSLQNLETLNLGDCLLKTNGAVLIAKALASKHSYLQVRTQGLHKHSAYKSSSNCILGHFFFLNLFQTLILEHNEINLDGGMEVVRAMQDKSSLVVLNLNGNNFGVNGIAKIKDKLKSNERPDAIQSFR